LKENICALPRIAAHVSVNDLLIKALALALSEFSFMNARMEGNEIHELGKINIGIAVDTKAGVRVPVIRSCLEKRLLEIAAERKRLVEAARTGALDSHSEQGGTFTISSLSGTEVTHFSPILRLPETAILGIGKTTCAYDFSEAVPVPKKIFPLSLTFDHRLVDGAPAAAFLTRFVEILEHPYGILL
jgi:pyruvate dehydrogenase E2 component (dihydrolipoamide acetyltransferase)